MGLVSPRGTLLYSTLFAWQDPDVIFSASMYWKLSLVGTMETLLPLLPRSPWLPTENSAACRLQVGKISE